MYLTFFHLKREPFNITPDPALLFLSHSHREALAAVISGVNRRKGFVAITGEVGVGKTTVIRAFLEKVDKQNIRAIYVFDSNITFKSLLRTIYQNLGKTSLSEDVSDMVSQLHMILIEEYRAGRNVVLIIDEAQNMPVETLENLRMLSNLETSTDKLIQIVLCGQPEFEQKLNMHALRQLNQRIAIRVKILPFSAQESLEYINHRLSRSLMDDTQPFSSGALARIVKKAAGIPRVINILCDNCLVTAYGKQQKKVSSRVAREIIEEQTGKRHSWWRVAAAGMTGILVSACFLWIYVHHGDSRPVAVQPMPVHGQVNRNATGNREQAAPPSPEKQAVVETQTDEGGQPVSSAPTPSYKGSRPENRSSYTVRVARRGDTLAKLVSQTYGSVDRGLLSQVKQHNPSITDIDKILEGEKIYFPARGK